MCAARESIQGDTNYFPSYRSKITDGLKKRRLYER